MDRRSTRWLDTTTSPSPSTPRTGSTSRRRRRSGSRRWAINYLKASRQLTAQGDHAAWLRHAVACSGILYELIDAMESGEEIVFADEGPRGRQEIRTEPRW